QPTADGDGTGRVWARPPRKSACGTCEQTARRPAVSNPPGPAGAIHPSSQRNRGEISMSRGDRRRARSVRRNVSSVSKAVRATALLGALGAVVLTACGGTVTGHASSPLTDPFRAGGLPVIDGPSGP